MQRSNAADTPAAERTRTKLLKVRVTLDYKNTPLREVLKEVAAQVESLAEKPVMWTYAPDVKAGQPITYSCEAKRVEEVLDDLGKLTGIGYIVVSKDDHKHDGWVRITKGPERGTGKYPDDAAAPAIDDPDEAKAAARLKSAKELIDSGKDADAKAVLKLVIDKHPKTKAAAEARALLEKLSK
jgi:hypothetical protein